MSSSFVPLVGRWNRWSVSRGSEWVHYAAPHQRLPEQGWKIHVSTVPQDAGAVLGAAAEWCLAKGWTFKHLIDTHTLARANEKNAPRSSSGKFVTIYPPADPTPAALDELVDSLGDAVGPRILSDLQWSESPVHLRYGAFRPLRTWDGFRAIRRPEGGLEPDRRGVVFDPPPWIAVPAWIQSEVDRLRTADPGLLADLTIDGAYSFSNAGGVYRADHARHGRVVVKEGRRHVAVHDGRDAAARIEQEHALLATLDGIGVAPRVFGTFRSGGSAFALLEQLNGTPFNRAVMSRNPLTRSPDVDVATRAAFAADVARTIDALRDQVAVLHAHGVVHGDISPRNVLVDLSGEVRLIDFESAQLDAASTTAGAGIATPGFAAPASLRGPARDDFSVACLHLAALLPLTSLIPLDPRKLHDLLLGAARWFPSADLDSVRTTLSVAAHATTAQRPGSDYRIRSLATGLRRRACVSDRAGLHDGRHGIVLALGRAGIAAPRAQPTFRDGDPDLIGLFTGHAAELMQPTASPALIEAVRKAPNTVERVDLEGGLAGLGCALVGAPGALAPEVLDAIAQRLVELTREPDSLGHLRPGLLNGPSGIALFLALHARVRADAESLTAAERALRVDVERLERAEHVGLQLRRDGRLVPFLASGSAGVGVAAIQVLRAGGTGVTSELLQGIHDASATPLTAHAGTLDGRAGLVHFLVDLAESNLPGFDRAGIAGVLDEHRQAFSLHRLRTPEGDRYPNLQLTAPDDGYAHGGAGVLSALAAIRDLDRPQLGGLLLPSFLRGGRQ